MKKIVLNTLALLSISVFATAQTQPEVESETITTTISLINTDKNPELEIVKSFKEPMSGHFLDPKAPRFLLTDQKQKVAFGIGGFVRLRAAYDFDGSPQNSFGFIPNSIPVPRNPAMNNSFDMDASKSTIFFKLLGNDDKIGKFQAYISGQFTGNNNAFELNDAYVQLLGLTLGRTWSTFNDMAAVPPTVDFQGPAGAAEMRTTQIRYTYSLDNGLQFAIAAERPETTGTYTTDVTEKASQRLPDVPAYAQYSWGKGAKSHVRLAGVLRNMTYRDMVDNKNKTETGYGVQMSTNVNATPLVEFYGQITYGKGIAEYINDLSGNGLSLVADSKKPGNMHAQEALGWLTQVQFNLTKSVFTTVGYSQAKVFSDDKYDAPASQYNYGQYIVGNVFYNVTSNLQVGGEYLWGNRVNMDGEKNSANRIQTVIQYSF